MDDTTPFAAAAARVAAGADHRVEAASLVADMTVAEKLGCLDGDTPFWPGLVDMVSGGYYRHSWPAAAVDRLGIPGIEFADGPRGCVLAPATAFPVSMARGASFDPDLEARVGDAIGAELRARGATYTGAVCMNLLRHPAWGRAQETYGEDPHHVGVMAEALTVGLQRHVMACMKHFALNSMENARFTVDVTIDERALHEVYLPHFRRVAAAGVASVMSAYNSVNGEWCGENAQLLRDVLRREWEWDGFVTSDFIFGLRNPVQSVAAGLNIEMPFRQQRALALAEAVESGTLDMAVVDELVVETVATLLRFAHVFRNTPDASVVACPDHRDLAREVASASMVLVRNDGLLPLRPQALRKVAVLGRLAAVANLGDHGSSNVTPPQAVTLLEGLRSGLTGVEVVHHDEDAAIAGDADVAVVVVGYTEADEGEFLDTSAQVNLLHLFPPMEHPEVGLPPDMDPDEAFAVLTGGGSGEEGGGSDDAPQASFTVPGGDRASLRLHAEHEALIRAAAEACDDVLVVVMGGSAVVMPWLEDVSATLLVWYPGMEGGHALADVVLGRCEPGGRLPFAVPYDEAQLVPFDRDATEVTYGLLHGQWKLDADGEAAHLPFGFGLGYTTFAVEPGPTLVGDTVCATVTNTGDRYGDAVVQVYGSVPDSVHQRPPRRLVGFARVSVAPGASAEVDVPVDLRLLDVRIDGTWVREDRPVVLTVGLDAAHADTVVTDAR
ncbi:MAG: glycoside hydrolase family 3 C-terminal domain-containing protein [Acidimicrobiia bacterium]|nr:glycoside hydrolase family 3 C-terminal domain-containing protein [Acidimicrobiia bacterium]